MHCVAFLPFSFDQSYILILIAILEVFFRSICNCGVLLSNEFFPYMDFFLNIKLERCSKIFLDTLQQN